MTHFRITISVSFDVSESTAISHQLADNTAIIIVSNPNDAIGVNHGAG